MLFKIAHRIRESSHFLWIEAATGIFKQTSSLEQTRDPLSLETSLSHSPGAGVCVLGIELHYGVITTRLAVSELSLRWTSGFGFEMGKNSPENLLITLAWSWNACPWHWTPVEDHYNRSCSLWTITTSVMVIVHPVWTWAVVMIGTCYCGTDLYNCYH